MPTESNKVVMALVEEMDAAYETGHFHSLIGNLNTVPTEAWDWAPPRGERTIRELVRHIAACKLLYLDQALNGGQRTWDDIVSGRPRDGATVEDELAFLASSHAQWRAGVAALDDDDLQRLTRNHMNGSYPVRWFVTTMIHHDLYHCGEINHIRSLFTGDDSWGQEGDR